MSKYHYYLAILGLVVSSSVYCMETTKESGSTNFSPEEMVQYYLLSTQYSSNPEELSFAFKYKAYHVEKGNLPVNPKTFMRKNPFDVLNFEPKDKKNMYDALTTAREKNITTRANYSIAQQPYHAKIVPLSTSTKLPDNSLLLVKVKSGSLKELKN
jgi:hypothetical protein